MTNQTTRMSVFIGRFQPPHQAHIEIIKRAVSMSEHVVVLIGSAYKPACPKNPFSHVERRVMIESCFTPSEKRKLSFCYISDSPYNEAAWIRSVQQAIDNCYQDHYGSHEAQDITLIGHHKDESSYYLDTFPTFKQVEVANIYGLDSTTIRDLYLAGREAWEKENYQRVAAVIPMEVMAHLLSFMETPEYDRLVKEHEFIKLYKSQWANSPYPPTFVTADAVVTNMGHILLVKRKAAPGAGLWALPGGFLGQYETVRQCAVRELLEETRIKVPPRIVESSIVKEKRYDHPRRSLRGRTVTTAFLFELHDRTLPKVKGSDDAASAKWFSFNEFIRMQNCMYEDHYNIITDMLGLG